MLRRIIENVQGDRNTIDTTVRRAGAPVLLELSHGILFNRSDVHTLCRQLQVDSNVDTKPRIDSSAYASAATELARAQKTDAHAPPFSISK